MYIAYWDTVNNLPAFYIGQLVMYSTANEIMIPAQITTREHGEIQYYLRFSLEPKTKKFTIVEY